MSTLLWCIAVANLMDAVAVLRIRRALLAANIGYIDGGALVLPTLPTDRSES